MSKNMQSIRVGTEARINDELEKRDFDTKGKEETTDGNGSDAASVFGGYAACTAPQSKRLSFALDAEFDACLAALPQHIRRRLLDHVSNAAEILMDVVMDLGRAVRFVLSGTRLPIDLRDCLVTAEDIQFVVDQCGDITDANRACVG